MDKEGVYERVEKAKEAYRRGLEKSAMSAFGRRAIAYWAERYKVAMLYEEAKRKRREGKKEVG